MIKALMTAATVVILTGCAAATPLLVAEAGGHQLARYDEDIKVRAAAALDDEPDLLTYSVQAISRGKTDDAAATYMKGYSDPDYSQNMKSLALYQIALLYMNRFSDERDDAKARAYLLQHRIEFPDSRLKERVMKRLAILDEREKEPVQLSAVQLLKQVDRSKLLKVDNTPFDAELTPMSERAITEGRVADAESVYLILYDNKASSAEMRAKALYQLGLIYMSPYNQAGNNQKAMAYFRKIGEEFPNTSVAKRSSERIAQLINRQE
ncbi:tetratricopeptide repeat protein [Thalassolituus sp. LLYu03]|uniref:tetratricopeptide repeat protein n=1 Tax=Thalassolituus sp. LLYu03 TaxID=3421656 RepID=UPI003D27F235